MLNKVKTRFLIGIGGNRSKFYGHDWLTIRFKVNRAFKYEQKQIDL